MKNLNEKDIATAGKHPNRRGYETSSTNWEVSGARNAGTGAKGGDRVAARTRRGRPGRCHRRSEVGDTMGHPAMRKQHPAVK